MFHGTLSIITKIRPEAVEGLTSTLRRLDRSGWLRRGGGLRLRRHRRRRDKRGGWRLGRRFEDNRQVNGKAERTHAPPNAKRPQVIFGQLKNSHDVRRERQYDVGLLGFAPIVGEETTDDRQIAQATDSGRSSQTPSGAMRVACASTSTPAARASAAAAA